MCVGSHDADYDLCKLQCRDHADVISCATDASDHSADTALRFGEAGGESQGRRRGSKLNEMAGGQVSRWEADDGL